MSGARFLSIDQNSHPLWDTIPKLHAMQRYGWQGCHCVEDVDVAFTRRQADVGESDLELVRERTYRGGTSDWGAALFYSDLLGRSMIDVREFEPYTGWTTAALSRRLDCAVDDLYERYGWSDNWQLIGPSYVGNEQRHRVVGDVGLAEVLPFVRQLLEHARGDLLARFPERSARQRVRGWFGQEEQRLEHLLRRCAGGTLVDLYGEWVRAHVGSQVDITTTSSYFAPHAAWREDAACQVLEVFVQQYDTLARLYNEAIVESGGQIKPLRCKQGELPFFLVWRRQGRLYRTAVHLADDCLVSDDQSWPLRSGGRLPLEALCRAGLVCICGKALLLVLQARVGTHGQDLVLPYQGSLYMPSAYLLQQKLVAAGVLAGPVRAVQRVRFNFLEAWRGLGTVVRLPLYLQTAFGGTELTATAFAEALPAVWRQARAELAQARSAPGREQLQARLAPDQAAELIELEKRRRELAGDPVTRSQAGQVWAEAKVVQRQLLERLVNRVEHNLQVLGLAYWDSRGALLPWSVALGGESFYQQLVANAQVYPEG